MSKSIESIWQNGFIKSVDTAVPKVNNLYDKKSDDLVDKFSDMFKLNQRMVLLMASVLLAVLVFIGAPVLGVLVALMFIGLVAVGRKQLVELQKIKKDSDCYCYLVSFNNWLQSAIDKYAKIYRFFYPLLFVLCGLRLCYSELLTQFFNDLGLEPQVIGLPLLALGVILLVAIVLGLSGSALYRADVNLVYGKQIDKLKELIDDMEQLRN